ncbi:MAG TPA: tetratricopeptide repeat protein [Bacteroidia bacterium]|nr:tetratricopeptide repeat protein [Bacteroidia bacterium]
MKLFNIKRVFIFFLLALWLGHEVMAAETKLFEQANTFYKNKNYNKAIELYKKIIAKDNASAAVYFNLGNAYYKTSETGLAILNYERALKLQPNDDDIEYNLKLANMQTTDKIEPVPQVFYQRWWTSLITAISLSKRTLVSIILAWLSCIFFIAYLFIRNMQLKKIMFALALMLFAGLCVNAFLASQQYQQVNQKRFAIILATNPYIKSSPDEKSASLFMLHEGTKVEVLDELIGWKKIRIANGNVGWIAADALEQI